ncbi:hypothetical protein K461DRAFT_116873 [Myriangium duriaei CBS 260.36]|uniref:Uncharacterized protein n=1 Tax=Myriangium duriaei CBS 260.36 TaxID=1168546 RepID=A0A9P4MGP1_9PEZI|nr:hypothetical protein K461DRAFT_116873 [Myriangium duriaei CBS 260.36]
MAAPNGMQPGGGAPYGMGNAVMPSAGHHHDMQHVWSLVEELSGILQQNRERWDELQTGLSRAQIRPHEQDEDANGEEHPKAHTTAELSTQLVEAQRKIEALEAAYTDQAQLITAYENGMHDTAERLRNYVYEQTQATNAIHAHYNSLLSTSRNETLQAQLTHQAWQASVARVAEGVRLAYREQSEGARPYRKRIAALKEENRVLRAKAGWDPPSDSEEDEEFDDEEEQQQPPKSRGR